MSLKPIKLNNDTRRDLSEKIDPSLIKQRESFGNSKPLRYISQNTCTDILNKVFGHNWSSRIVERWMEPGVPFQKKGSSEPIPQGPTAWCIVELTVPFEDENGKIHYITKSAFGSQAITGNQNTQATNGYKGAQSDALKKAATLFGVALELYRDPQEENYFQENNNDLFNIWTPELKEQYESEWNYIDDICNINGFTYDDLTFWSNGKALTLLEPNELINLVDILKADEDIAQPEGV